MGRKPKDFNIVTYLEKFQQDVVDRVVGISTSGCEKDNVRLKANIKLLDKFVPDKQKLDIDVNGKATLAFLLEQETKKK
jgi:hypothetical protein